MLHTHTHKCLCYFNDFVSPVLCVFARLSEVSSRFYIYFCCCSDCVFMSCLKLNAICALKLYFCHKTIDGIEYVNNKNKAMSSQKMTQLKSKHVSNHKGTKKEKINANDGM